jgi:hypothetical protein
MRTSARKKLTESGEWSESAVGDSVTQTGFGWCVVMLNEVKHQFSSDPGGRLIDPATCVCGKPRMTDFGKRVFGLGLSYHSAHYRTL